MQSEENILDLLRRKAAETHRLSQRGLILQPGAIGDCILTLPLAKFMKDALGLGCVDVLAHSEYTDYMPGRTCVDGIRGIDSIKLAPLFAEARTFDIADGDPLIHFFADYTWIVTFLGEPDSDFEKNLIYTSCCSHIAEVITLPLKPPKDYSGHISDFYIRQLLDQCGLNVDYRENPQQETIIRPTKADIDSGRALLTEHGIDPARKLAVIAPGSGSREKCWHTKNFIECAHELYAHGFDVLFVLGPAEIERFDVETLEKISNTGGCVSEAPLTDIVRMLSCADTFIGNDSGITHLAAAMGLRTAAIFGPSDPAIYRPIGPAVRIFRNESPDFCTKHTPLLRAEIIKTIITGF